MWVLMILLATTPPLHSAGVGKNIDIPQNVVGCYHQNSNIHTDIMLLYPGIISIKVYENTFTFPFF